LQNRDLASAQRFLDRGRLDSLRAPDRFIRLRDNPGEVMPISPAPMKTMRMPNYGVS